MATIKTAVDIDIKVDGQTSVQQAATAYEDLGDAVSKTQLEAEKLAQQFGINDARTQEAIKVAGKYKGELEQLDFAIDAAKGGSDQLFRASQGVLGGFEAAAGAAALFGVENENLEATLVKLQGAMALSQGLKDFNEFLPAIKNVAGSVTGPLVKAFQGFGKAARVAIASTGIGVLVVGIASIVAYWDKIKESISGVSREQSDLLESQKESVTASEEQLNAISQQENILKLQGKTDEEILQMKIDQTEVTIKNLQLQLETQKQVKKAQVETAQRNKDILQGIIRFVTLPITAILKGVDLITEGLVKIGAMDKALNLEEGFSVGLAGLIFDPEEVASEADKAIEEAENKIITLENTLAGYKLTAKERAKQRAKEQADEDKQEKEDAIQREKDFQDRLKEVQQEQIDREQKEYEDSLKNLENYYKEKELLLSQSLLNGEISQEQFDQQMRQMQQEQLEAQLQVQRDYGQNTTETELEIAQKQIEINKQRNDSIKTQDQALNAGKKALYDSIMALGDAVIGLVGEQTKVGKGLALSQIAADTAVALTSALRNSQSPTGDNIATGGLAGIAKYIALATTILGNAKRARDILKGGGSASVSIGGSPSIPQVNTRQLQGSTLGQDFSGGTKVYVTEGDISKTQRRVQNLQRVSVVGG